MACGPGVAECKAGRIGSGLSEHDLVDSLQRGAPVGAGLIVPGVAGHLAHGSNERIHNEWIMLRQNIIPDVPGTQLAEGGLQVGAVFEVVDDPLQRIVDDVSLDSK